MQSNQNLNDSRWARSSGFRSTYTHDHNRNNTSNSSHFSSTSTGPTTTRHRSISPAKSKWASSRPLPPLTNQFNAPSASASESPSASASPLPLSSAPEPGQGHTKPGSVLSDDVLLDQPAKLPKPLAKRYTAYTTFVKLHRRLKWKSATLLLSYQRTMNLIHQHNNNNNTKPNSETPMQAQGQGQASLHALTLPTTQDEPETMFKIDFFEFYVLLERVLVALLGVWGWEVSAMHAVDLASVEADGRFSRGFDDPQAQRSTGGGGADEVPAEGRGLIGNSKVLLKGQTVSRVSVATPMAMAMAVAMGGTKWMSASPSTSTLTSTSATSTMPTTSDPVTKSTSKSRPTVTMTFTHSFHANVLAALDMPSCPLYPVLGQGDVRNYLGIAKSWRNKWKDAEDKVKDAREDGLVGSRYEKMLRDLRLEGMLACIVAGVDEGGKIADVEVREFLGVFGFGPGPGSAGTGTGLNMGLDAGVPGDDGGMMDVDIVETWEGGSGHVPEGSGGHDRMTGPMEAVDDMMDCD